MHIHAMHACPLLRYSTQGLVDHDNGWTLLTVRFKLITAMMSALHLARRDPWQQGGGRREILASTGLEV